MHSARRKLCGWQGDVFVLKIPICRQTGHIKNFFLEKWRYLFAWREKYLIEILADEEWNETADHSVNNYGVCTLHILYLCSPFCFLDKTSSLEAFTYVWTCQSYMFSYKVIFCWSRIPLQSACQAAGERFTDLHC